VINAVIVAARAMGGPLQKTLTFRRPRAP